jgi:hypothetical protein
MTMPRWTPKLAVSRSRRNLAGAIERLRTVSLEWSEVDQSFVDAAENFVRDLEDFAERIESETKQRLEAGEHVGL